MNQEVAEGLAKQIPRDCPQCIVEGINERQGHYVIDVRHTATGERFEVTSREAWEQQLRDGRVSMAPEHHR